MKDTSWAAAVLDRVMLQNVNKDPPPADASRRVWNVVYLDGHAMVSADAKCQVSAETAARGAAPRAADAGDPGSADAAGPSTLTDLAVRERLDGDPTPRTGDGVPDNLRHCLRPRARPRARESRHSSTAARRRRKGAITLS